MRVLFPNFDFDDTLAGRSSAKSSAARRVLEDLAPLFAVMGQPGDLCLCPLRPDGLPSLLADVKFTTSPDEVDCRQRGYLLPFGWCSAAQDLNSTLGLDSESAPSIDAVRLVNAREFGAAFDRTLAWDGSVGSESPFGVVCQTEYELIGSLASLVSGGQCDWLLKPQFSHAGRNQLRGRGASLSRPQRNWVRGRLDAGEPVYLEPRVEIVREWGLQFEVSSDVDESRLIGVTESLVERGQYAGSVCDGQQILEPEVHAVAKAAEKVCRAASTLGYFGPLGIDCFMYLNQNGHRFLRLCSDINGRLTMGRLALAFAEKLGGRRFCCLVLVKREVFEANPALAGDYSCSHGAEDVDVISVSPQIIGNRKPATIAVILAADSVRRIMECRAELFPGS